MVRVIKTYHDNKQLKEEYFVNNRKIEGNIKNISEMDNLIQYVIISMEKRKANTKIIMKMDNCM